MKIFQTLLLSVCAVLSAYGIGFDVFKEPGDVRPVTFTVPVKSGEKETKWFAKAGGKDIFLQTAVISRYPDGSPRWYKASGFVPAGRVEVLPLKADAPAQKNQLSVSNSGVTNSIWQISFSKKPFEARFVRDGEVITFGAPEITLPDGSRPEAVLTEEKDIETGPVQIIKEFSGKYLPMPEGEVRYWRLRVTMWADCDFICIDPTLGVTLEARYEDTAKEMRSFKSAVLKINTGKKSAFFDFFSHSKSSSVTQWEDDAYEICRNGKKEVVKGSAGAFSTAKAAIYIPEMAERFPIGATVGETACENGITVNLFPEIIPADRYAGRDDEYIRFFAVRDGLYTIRSGIAVSFPFFVGHKDNGKLSAFKKTPVALVDAEELNKTGAWLHIIHKICKRTALLDKEIKVGLDAYFSRQKKERWYGFMNYGDWHGERKWNWGNHEYDTAAVFLEQSIRFRDPELFREGLRCARHQMEIDTVKNNFGKTAVYKPGIIGKFDGGVYTHVVGHTGGYYKPETFRFHKGKKGGPFLDDRFSPGHHRIRGMTMAYVLSGDRRFYDTACMTGDYIDNHIYFLARMWFDTHREPGWSLINLTSIYWMDPQIERFYKAVCKVASIVMERAAHRGVYHGFLGETYTPKPKEGWTPETEKYRFGALSFPTGYQAIGMYMASKMVKDPEFKKEILQNLADTAHYVKTRHYFPERKGFTHRPCPWRLQSTAVGGVGANALRNVLLIDAVLTGNKESEEISRSTIMQMLKYRELYHSPQKNNHPDHPTAKNAGAIIYFMPLMMELMEQLNWELPETIEYAPIRKNNGILPKE